MSIGEMSNKNKTSKGEMSNMKCQMAEWKMDEKEMSDFIFKTAKCPRTKCQNLQMPKAKLKLSKCQVSEILKF